MVLFSVQISELYFPMAFNNVHDEKQKQRVELLQIETRNLVNEFSHIGKLRKPFSYGRV